MVKRDRRDLMLVLKYRELKILIVVILVLVKGKKIFFVDGLDR